MFDPSVMTILVQAAGGSGSWRMWHYVVVDETTLDDITAPGFFGPMDNHIESGSIVYVTAPGYVAQLAIIRRGNELTAHPMASAEFDASQAYGEHPLIQNMPQGTTMHAESDLTRHNSTGGPVKPDNLG